VIAKKCREWLHDEHMNEYLRPATLFNRTKFAQYQGELVPPGRAMKCPDCREELTIEATACRCGWKATKGAGPYEVAGAPKPVCRAVGCHQAAMRASRIAGRATSGIRHEAAEARCRELGLTTVEAKSLLPPD
jgi:hypothetical protein